MRAGIAKIVQNLAKMLHETIVDYYVNFVLFTVYGLQFTDDMTGGRNTRRGNHL